MKTIPLNTYIKTNDGFDGIVVSNSEKSYYGHCPDGMVIVRLEGGVTLRAISECIIT
jgi:hypothetical protein